jgi:FlaA1/EpsC-like NDP-sugar epimerase
VIYSLRNRNFRIIFLGDVFLLLLAHYFAYYIRFDGVLENDELINFLRVLPWMIPIKILALFYFDLYKGMWRYTGIYDLINLIKAVTLSSVVVVSVLLISFHFVGFSRGVFVIDFLLTIFVLGGSRMGIRLVFSGREGEKIGLFRKRTEKMKKVLIIGAGDAGEMLAREVRDNPYLAYDIVGFIDDNPHKVGRAIHGIGILSTLDELGGIAESSHADEIVIAMPSASAADVRRAVKLCESTGLPYKTIPGMGELMEGKVSVSSIRDVRYEDLLGRKSVDLEVEQIGGYLTGKRVMVTGGAGSIGSELCRQIVRFKPERLVIVDRNESGLYETEMDFLSKYPGLKLVPVLGPVQTRDLMEKVFQENRPQVVFHAAAYKHVPMMEMHPWEAVYNNILGTQTVLDLCRENGVDRYVLVSTDKAVRPTNVMGTSKRVAELLTQGCAREYNVRCMAVRFGNVVGSIGSVVPFFQKQIERGGPVTVTHPDVTRYFMTIPEASRLILQAGAMGQGSEIFILKMGTPVRISDMARDMISLSGFKPDEDIEIKYVGLRPGEKLFEELITEGEGIQPTRHDEIMVLQAEECVSLKDLNRHIKTLVKLADAGDGDGIRAELKRMVPEYEPWESNGKTSPLEQPKAPPEQVKVKV